MVLENHYVPKHLSSVLANTAILLFSSPALFTDIEADAAHTIL